MSPYRRRVMCALSGARAYRMLIGAWNLESDAMHAWYSHPYSRLQGGPADCSVAGSNDGGGEGGIRTENGDRRGIKIIPTTMGYTRTPLSPQCNFGYTVQM